MKKEAIISDCGKYRFQLSRIWDETKPLVLFIMHNPSTADADQDDPTIRRCINFAKDWGYGGIYVGNLSPYRATDPKNIKGCPEQIYAHNMHHLTAMRMACDKTVLAFGNPAEGILRGSKVNPKGYYYLKLTKSGNPCHPLYLKKDLTPIAF